VHSAALIGTKTPRDERLNNQTRGGNRYGCWLSFSFPITRNLRILAWYANSVFDKKAELELFLRTNNIDVAAISEIKLHPKRKFTMPGFKVYRSDRNQFGGGVMLLINNNLRHDSFSLLPLSGLEATAICLQPQNYKPTAFRLRLPYACRNHRSDGPRRHRLTTRHRSPRLRPQLQARVMEQCLCKQEW
jgi:hypothetical protein